MNPLETLRIALRALLRNKTRSSLTALGIILGVAGSRGQSAQGPHRDDTCFVPSSTFQAKIQGGLAAYVSGSLVRHEPALRPERVLSRRSRGRRDAG